MGFFIVVLINGAFRFFIMLPVKFIQSTVLQLMIDFCFQDSSFLNAKESDIYIRIIDFFFLFVGGYRIVYKKVPQFIVPDLAGFELKPYVSYKSPKVEIPPPTAESLLTSIKENIHLIKYRETP